MRVPLLGLFDHFFHPFAISFLRADAKMRFFRSSCWVGMGSFVIEISLGHPSPHPTLSRNKRERGREPALTQPSRKRERGTRVSLYPIWAVLRIGARNRATVTGESSFLECQPRKKIFGKAIFTSEGAAPRRAPRRNLSGSQPSPWSQRE